MINKSGLGVGYITLSAVFYASYGVWSRLMIANFGEFSQAWTRGLLLLIVVLILGKTLTPFKKIKKSDWPWYIAIGVAGGLNQAPYFYGFEHLGIGTATLLFYASLVVSGYIQGKIFFGEVLGGKKIVSLLMALLGMGLIYQLSLTSDQFWPAVATIFAGILGASGVVLTKKLSANYPESQIMTSYLSAQVLINLPLALILGDNLPQIGDTTAWLPQLGYATSMLLANLAVIAGFKHLEPSVGSVLGTTEILFGIAFGVLLFGEVVTAGVVAGGVLILLAVVLPNLKTLLNRHSV